MSLPLFITGEYYARIKSKGKEVRRKLETKDLALAKRRLRVMRDEIDQLDECRVHDLGELLEKYRLTVQGVSESTLAAHTTGRERSHGLKPWRLWSAFGAKRGFDYTRVADVVTESFTTRVWAWAKANMADWENSHFLEKAQAVQRLMDWFIEENIDILPNVEAYPHPVGRFGQGEFAFCSLETWIPKRELTAEEKWMEGV